MNEVNFIIICEKAFFTDASKTLNLIGIFDRIVPHSGLPIIAKFSIATSIEAEVGLHKQKIIIQKENSLEPLLEQEFDIHIKEVGQGAQTAIDITNLPIKEPGTYLVQTKIDGNLLAQKAKLVVTGD